VQVSGPEAHVHTVPRSVLEVWSVASTVYPVIELPPSDAGAVQVTVADPLPGVAATPVGAPGVVAGVTGEDAADASPAPTAFMARTVKV